MNKFSAFIYSVCIMLGLFLVFNPGVVNWRPFPPSPPVPPPTPVDPELQFLVNGLSKYIQAGEDADLIGATVLSASNLFEIDASRQNPLYSSIEAKKKAIRNIGDLTLGAGFQMESKYPGLAAFLAEYFKNVTTTEDIVVKLRNVSQALSLL